MSQVSLLKLLCFSLTVSFQSHFGVWCCVLPVCRMASTLMGLTKRIESETDYYLVPTAQAEASRWEVQHSYFIKFKEEYGVTFVIT